MSKVDLLRNDSNHYYSATSRTTRVTHGLTLSYTLTCQLTPRRTFTTALELRTLTNLVGRDEDFQQLLFFFLILLLYWKSFPDTTFYFSSLIYKMQTQMMVALGLIYWKHTLCSLPLPIFFLFCNFLGRMLLFRHNHDVTPTSVWLSEANINTGLAKFSHYAKLSNVLTDLFTVCYECPFFMS